MNGKNALKVEELTKIYSKKSNREIKALNNLNNIEQNPLTAPVGKPSLFLERGGRA